jgi:hypothetical protein
MLLRGSQLMKCPKCGTVNRWEATRCEKCGTFLVQDHEPVMGEKDDDDLESLIKEWPAPEPAPEVPLKEKPPEKPDPRSYNPYYYRRFKTLLYGSYVAVVIVVLIVLTFVVIGPHMDTSGNGNQATVTDPLVGTWGTTGPVTFFAMTNWPSGNMTNIGTENRTIDFVIAESASGKNMVQVTMNYLVVSSNISDGAMYGAEQTPQIISGQETGNTLTLFGNGNNAVFTFNAVSMTGTWNSTHSFTYFTEQVHTEKDALTMIKLPG